MTGQTVPSALTGVDWPAVAFAMGMATVMSVLVTLRARNLPRPPGVPAPTWASVIPDTLLGGLVGATLAVVVPKYIVELRDFAGTWLLAGVGGILGPRVTDWIGAHGLETALDWLGSGAGRLASALSKRKGGGQDGS